MTDDFDSPLNNFDADPVDAFDEIETVEDEPMPALARSTKQILVDYCGDGSVSPQFMAPIVVMASGAEPRVLHPGLNRVEDVDGHPGFARLIEAGVVKVDVKIPRQLRPPKGEGVIGLVERTWSASGLDAIMEVESEKESKRKVAIDAIERQRLRIAKRSKPTAR